MLKRAWSKFRIKSALIHLGCMVAFLLIATQTPQIQQLDNRINDLALQDGDKIGSPDIVILEIDDRTKDDAGNYPLSRDYLADVIENITKIRPKKILFDGILVADGVPADDQRLSMAIEKLGSDKIAIGGLNKTDTQPITLPNAKFGKSSTVFGAGFYQDADGLHRTVTSGIGSAQTLINPSRWLAGETSYEPVIIDQGIDPESYLRLPISEFKGQADLNLINKVFIIGEATDLSHSKITYPTKNAISRAAFIAVGADTVIQGTHLFKVNGNVVLQFLFGLGAIAIALVLALKTNRHVFFAILGGSGTIIAANLVGLKFFEALMNVTLMLVAWNGVALIALAYKSKIAEMIYDFRKGDLSAEEARLWRELSLNDQPLILLGANRIKRINAGARGLGICENDLEIIETIQAVTRNLASDEQKTLPMNLLGSNRIISMSLLHVDPAFITLEDVTEANEAPDRVAAVFETDTLTKCQNKAGFYKAVRALAKLNDPYTVFKLELSGYSAIRELHGTKAADALLVKAAECFKDHLREDDVIARFKDDQFAILIKGSQSLAYLNVTQETLEKALGTNVRINGHTMAIAVCSGLAQSKNDQDYEQLIATAEEAKHVRKQQFKSKGRAIAQIEKKAA